MTGAASILAVLCLWEACARLRIFEATFLPPPTLILATTWRLLLGGVLVQETVATFGRVAAGFGLSIALGLAVALICNLSRTLQSAIVPVVEVIRGIAPLALLPAFMLIFGLGFNSMIAMIVWVAWIPIFLNTTQGMSQVDRVFIKAARALGSTPWQIATRVILPAAAPYIIAGLRLGIGSSFLVIVAAEMLGANNGLGFYILETSQTFKVLEMYSAILTIGVLGLVLNWVFTTLGDRMVPWTRAR